MQTISNIANNLIFKNSVKEGLNYSLPSIFQIPQKRFKHYAPLTNRGLIRVKGTDATKYLHSIVTNKVQKEEKNCLYADFLTNKGRVLCDSIIYRLDSNKKNTKKEDEEDEEIQEYLIDVDKSLVPFLLKYLRRYILRSDIRLFNASKSLKVWSVWPSENESEADFQKGLNDLGVVHVEDPRCPALGYRIIGKQLENSVFSNSTKSTEDDYKVRRILYGIPEGPKEIIKSQSFPFEANLDFLNGVDYHKGCYIGQELTYRTHKRGTTRKRLVPVQFYNKEEGEPEKLTVNTNWEKITGIKTGTKLIPKDGEGRIKSLYRDGIFNIGMALVNVNLFQKGAKKSVKFSVENDDKIMAKAFLPDFIDLTEKEEKKEE
ncbi:Aminomethyltransferase folate-binding domain-containing protein [Piromyces finnis]|uniref:Aminomethyltransferase folate-binding domain-containing protein n=1 Tax=Piromyces finnis TaxID=1754191 RepID=A0A1Y1VAT8_9FUNG|nr:Aminomethyltransferase folate-binding domain-containing protein [Piromyces finnis]|eukprot:ORX51367.1 Aminomethyltransferase folate-binding domain-containing protein [Piromyces finnis]